MLAHGGVASGRSLALVMIVRNEAAGIERCLRSAAPWVDDLVVLDTGSEDRTVALAKACGARVHSTAWPGSFAEARNRALELADADWNLVLDGDEWIHSGGECLRDWVRAAQGPGVLRIDSEGAHATSSDWITRVLPRGVRYEGAVHEQPVCALPRQRLPVVIGHAGYRPAALQQKRGRNRALLLSALEQAQGQDAYLLFQLGKDHETYGELDRAAERYLEALRQVQPQAPFYPQLVVRAMHCLGKSGRLPTALDLASDHIDRLADHVNYQFTLGDLCLDGAVAQPDQAVSQWLPLAEAAWLRCLELGERSDQDGYVSGRGSYLAAHNLHVLYEGVGDRERARRYQGLGERSRQRQTSASG